MCKESKGSIVSFQKVRKYKYIFLLAYICMKEY